MTTYSPRAVEDWVRTKPTVAAVLVRGSNHRRVTAVVPAQATPVHILAIRPGVPRDVWTELVLKSTTLVVPLDWVSQAAVHHDGTATTADGRRAVVVVDTAPPGSNYAWLVPLEIPPTGPACPLGTDIPPTPRLTRLVRWFNRLFI